MTRFIRSDRIEIINIDHVEFCAVVEPEAGKMGASGAARERDVRPLRQGPRFRIRSRRRTGRAGVSDLLKDHAE